MTPMDIADLRRRFELACELYRIPARMYTHGLQQLESIFDLPASTSRNLFLRPQTGCHRIVRPYSCFRMVYLLFKGEGLSYNERNNSIIIPATAEVYAGQTANFRTRESSRRGRMRDSDVILCLSHDLTMYQRDSLETISILFSLLLFGLRCQNNTIYPVHVYLTIPSNMTWEDTYSQNMLTPTNTWAWSNRVLVIGTAPPYTVLTDAAYITDLQDNRNPSLRWIESIARSRNIAYLAHLLQDAVDALPPFIDHWPTMECDNWGNFRRAVTFADIREADRNLMEAITRLNRDVIVMVGRRPTLLYPHNHHSSYFVDICPNIDVYWFQGGTCGFVFWWLHPGLRRHATQANALLIEHILQLSSIQLRIVLYKINLVSGDGIGIPEATAAELIPWILELPISQQINELLRKLSRFWASGSEDHHQPAHPFSMDAIYFHDVKVVGHERVPHEVEMSLLPVSIEVRLPETSVSQVIKDWSDGYKTSVMRKTLQRVPNFYSLSNEDQALELQRTSRIHYASLLRGILNRWKSTGRFFPFEGESLQDQWVRLFKQINFERLNKSIHPQASWYTCCWCGTQYNRVLYEGKGMVARHASLYCPNGLHLTMGWQIIDHSYTGMFPDCNLFAMFYQSLPAGKILNQKQVAAALMKFIYKLRWHPQAKYLYQEYEQVAPLVESFESSAGLKAQVSNFTRGAKNAMIKLASLSPPLTIQWTTRYTLAEELANRNNISSHQTLFGINTCFEDPKMMIPLETFDYLGYRQHFDIQSIGEYFSRD